LLSIFCIVFLVPKEIFKTKLSEIFNFLRNYQQYIFIILGVVIFHLVEVNIIDPITTDWVSVDFAYVLEGFEGNILLWFRYNWTPVFVYFFVFIYIAVYPFTLWFSPVYFLISGKKKSLKILSYGLLVIYAVSLPFYLFVPVTNVYKFYGFESALEFVIPSIDSFFYSTTTVNNCLPSLHIAMSILIAWCMYLTGNKKLSLFTFFSMVFVAFSVIYLSIHWITDVLFGILLSVAVIFLLNRYIEDV